jgi:hypothetical protein
VLLGWKRRIGWRDDWWVEEMDDWRMDGREKSTEKKRKYKINGCYCFVTNVHLAQIWVSKGIIDGNALVGII